MLKSPHCQHLYAKTTPLQVEQSCAKLRLIGNRCYWRQSCLFQLCYNVRCYTWRGGGNTRRVFKFVVQLDAERFAIVTANRQFNEVIVISAPSDNTPNAFVELFDSIDPVKLRSELLDAIHDDKQLLGCRVTVVLRH